LVQKFQTWLDIGTEVQDAGRDWNRGGVGGRK
jgi:hypothetical protein